MEELIKYVMSLSLYINDMFKKKPSVSNECQFNPRALSL